MIMITDSMGFFKAFPKYPGDLEDDERYYSSEDAADSG